jgi:hypothetical protein
MDPWIIGSSLKKAQTFPIWISDPGIWNLSLNFPDLDFRFFFDDLDLDLEDPPKRNPHPKPKPMPWPWDLNP